MPNPFFSRRLSIVFGLALALVFSASGQTNFFSVSTKNDSGNGSLRTAITNANTTAGINVIRFNLTGPSPFTINLSSALPVITNTMTIDGTTQTNYAGTPLIEINGTSAGTNSGLQLNAPGCTVMGLAINRFVVEGIKLNSASNVIQGNFIGTDPSGLLARTNSGDGILVTSQGNLIGGTTAAARNIISGNGQAGILVSGSGATGNVIEGNYIGTDIRGTNALANSTNGIQINLAAGNIIGPSNVISGNSQIGIFISGSTANSNAVIGNFIGTDASGRWRLANSYAGVTVSGGRGNQIGGLNPGNGNVISGNTQDGIFLTGGTTGTMVQGNLIGLSAAGTNAIANGYNGVSIANSSSNNLGGSASGAGNFISGNTLNGVAIEQTNDAFNLVAGNYIGTDFTGLRAVANLLAGVLVQGRTNTIGWKNKISGSGNVISGNGQIGVWLLGTNGSVRGNLVAGNLIGLDATGTNILGNGNAGVEITSAATNQIGGMASAARNVISGNGYNGLILTGASTTGNLIQGNYIGTDASGTLARGNSQDGIELLSVTNNQIGGINSDAVTLDAGNLISGNNTNALNSGNIGIYLTNSALNVIQGNRIGTDVTGTLALGNSWNGIYLFSGTSNQIGGGNIGSGNLVSGNGRAGIYLTNSTGQFIQGNYIGTDLAGSNAVANLLEGIDLEKSNNNLIGGPGAGNLISGVGTASHSAVLLYTANKNTIQGNLVGPNATGNALVNNNASRAGLVLWNSSSNQIGGTLTGAGNVVSGNGSEGLYFTNATWNYIQGNLIGVAADGISPMGNNGHNIDFDTGSTNNVLGGVASGAGNIIAYAKIVSGANNDGVRVRTNTFNNLISGNAIHHNSRLGINLGNTGVNPNVPCESSVSATDANRLQNYPILSNATSGNLATLIRGSFDSAVGKTYALEFFASPTGNTNGYGEGQVFLGQTNLTLAGGCSTNFSITLASVPTNWVVTATATDPANNTSEFSNWVTNRLLPVPLAATATYTRTAGVALVVYLTNLATNWNDGGGTNLVSLLAISLTSTNGITLTTNSSMINYPGNSPNVKDQFSYIITDGFSTNTGLVNINVVGSVAGQIKGISLDHSAVTVNFAGVSGWLYNVQRSTNLMSWVTLLTTNAPVGGLFQFTDTFGDLGSHAPGAAYYQLFWQP